MHLPPSTNSSYALTHHFCPFSASEGRERSQLFCPKLSISSFQVAYAFCCSQTACLTSDRFPLHWAFPKDGGASGMGTMQDLKHSSRGRPFVAKLTAEFLSNESAISTEKLPSALREIIWPQSKSLSIFLPGHWGRGESKFLPRSVVWGILIDRTLQSRTFWHLVGDFLPLLFRTALVSRARTGDFNAVWMTQFPTSCFPKDKPFLREASFPLLP